MKKAAYVQVLCKVIHIFVFEPTIGSRLFIDGAELVENVANHGPVEEPGDIALKKGLDQIKVRYFQCGGRKM